MSKLNVEAWLELIALVAAMCLLLFIPAGTVRYLQAWDFLAVFFAGSVLITLYLMRYDRALLKRRVRAGPTAERELTQKIIMYVATIGFAGLLVVPALDHRFGWSHEPLAASIAGNILVAGGFCVVFLVYRQNSFTSATIEIAGGQKVVSSGPYAFLRHPMYAGSLLLLVGMPLVLGSYWGLLVLVPMITVLVLRLTDEEKLLAKGLPGYAEYRNKVHSRLIPGVY